MKPYIQYLIILGLLYALLYQCNTMMDNNKLSEANMEALSDSVRYYKNSIGTYTATVKTLQVDKEGLQGLVLNKDRELKQLAKEFARVKWVVQAKTEIKMDTIAEKFDSPIIVTDSAAPFMRTGNVSTDWFRFGYKVTNDSLVLSPFATWTETTVITGTKRKWFMGRQTMVTEITNSNPYVTVADIKSAEVVLREPWYRKWYVWLGVGIAGGLLVK